MLLIFTVGTSHSQTIEYPTQELWRWGDSFRTTQYNVHWNRQLEQFATGYLGEILIWQLFNDDPILQINLLSYGYQNWDFAWSPTGDYLAFISRRHSNQVQGDFIAIFDTRYGNLSTEISGRQYEGEWNPYFGAFSIDWHPLENNLFASNGYDVRLWHVDFESRTAELNILWEYDTLASGMDIDWSPNGEMIAAAGLSYSARDNEPPETVNPDNNTIRVWDKAGNFIRMLGTSANIAWSPDSRLIAGGDTNLTVWDVDSGSIVFETEMRTPTISIEIIQDNAWRPDGQVIAVATSDTRGLLYTPATIWLWNATNGEFLGQLDGHISSIYEIAWSMDSQYLVSVGDDGTTRIWGNP